MPIIRPADENTIYDSTDPDFVVGEVHMIRLSDCANLTQFGAFVETLSPGSRSSLRYRHAKEDEFVYMLSGQVILHEGESASPQNPSDAACFKTGVPIGHYIECRSDTDASYLAVGTRSGANVITYPDHDHIKIYNKRTGDEHNTTLDGTEGVGSAYSLPNA